MEGKGEGVENREPSVWSEAVEPALNCSASMTYLSTGLQPRPLGSNESIVIPDKLSRGFFGWIFLGWMGCARKLHGDQFGHHGIPRAAWHALCGSTQTRRCRPFLENTTSRTTDHTTAMTNAMIANPSAALVTFSQNASFPKANIVAFPPVWCLAEANSLGRDSWAVLGLVPRALPPTYSLLLTSHAGNAYLPPSIQLTESARLRAGRPHPPQHR